MRRLLLFTFACAALLVCGAGCVLLDTCERRYSRTHCEARPPRATYSVTTVEVYERRPPSRTVVVYDDLRGRCR
ncbi:MAG: hypothetical protein HY719_10695 [Planctomycetes bacterium]|nr:hypothetical protein [Planctomycetota bacterium]